MGGTYSDWLDKQVMMMRWNRINAMIKKVQKPLEREIFQMVKKDVLEHLKFLRPTNLEYIANFTLYLAVDANFTPVNFSLIFYFSITSQLFNLEGKAEFFVWKMGIWENFNLKCLWSGNNRLFFRESLYLYSVLVSLCQKPLCFSQKCSILWTLISLVTDNQAWSFWGCVV